MFDIEILNMYYESCFVQPFIVKGKIVDTYLWKIVAVIVLIALCAVTYSAWVADQLSWYMKKTKGSHYGLLFAGFEIREYPNKGGKRVYLLDGKIAAWPLIPLIEQDFNRLAVEGFHPSGRDYFKEEVVGGKVINRHLSGLVFKAKLSDYISNKNRIEPVGIRRLSSEEIKAPYDYERLVFYVSQERLATINKNIRIASK